MYQPLKLVHHRNKAVANAVKLFFLKLKVNVTNPGFLKPSSELKLNL